mmetsp:Transcript_6230/g.10739  ORF Transcript_6230/g.10739 Transcript_6230/m.10739 type:complete len:117 (+) Transcript_6230:151-501(+)|eukprot:CAMPEP_0196662336 /NCGR_PEP_ID=MMETSP1086-20130531/48252_1 /TAXON_ID=77921 /ORGANISM="Cyanoptyche  gloeocystis , Strain SAG4.97" /LENGTH=116 /DNA_ID=CAMNT_0041997667 /DNA_START=141 /DNA_END=491 /DNA_ORIENTATION=-
MYLLINLQEAAQEGICAGISELQRSPSQWKDSLAYGSYGYCPVFPRQLQEVQQNPTLPRESDLPNTPPADTMETDDMVISRKRKDSCDDQPKKKRITFTPIENSQQQFGLYQVQKT